ncbi:MAG: pseudouridine synthase, partial [Methanomicrobiales archaeon]|nr:pseudouridine synthase [Methanomicrobiales archaeon]
LPCAVDPGTYFPDLDVVPLANVPLPAPAAFADAWLPRYRGIAAVHPRSERGAAPGDVVMPGNWHTALAGARQYVDWLQALKTRIPPDTVWYAPAAALPSTAAFLLYSGFDLFDYTAVDLMSAKDLFCTPEGEFPAGEWLSGGCSCAGCAAGDLVMHNRLALEQEIAGATRFLKAGQLREFVEVRIRAHAPLVAALRLLDEAYGFVEPHVPVVRTALLRAYTAESLRRPEVKRFAERVTGRYVPYRTDTAVILPCSAKKPYSLSRSHHLFRSAIRDRAHELIMTSPLGLVPRELERIYPAAHYDIPVTGYWDREEREFIAATLAAYLAKHPYRRVIAHVEGGSLAIVRDAAERCGIELECTCRGHPTDGASLAALDAALDGERRMAPDFIRGPLSWQFGVAVNTKGMLLKGKWMNQKVIRGKEQLFSVDPATGLLRPTFAGWDELPGVYRVAIDDFVPQGDVLAPGITGADPQIREGDEVLVEGPRARATGRAVMGAGEMLASSYGVAIRIRKVQKLE